MTFETMQSPADGSFPAGDTAPSQGAAPEAGGAARLNDAPPAVTGADLADEIEAAALAAGLPVHEFLRPLHISNHGAQYVRQLRRAGRPLAATVDRFRKFIAAGGVAEGLEAPQPRAQQDRGEDRDRVNGLRHASELGKALRAPGETIAEAVQRECAEEAEVRAVARCAGGGIGVIDLSRVAHHPKHRKFDPLPPETWAGVRALAEERGEQPMTTLPWIVELGLQAARAAAQ